MAPFPDKKEHMNKVRLTKEDLQKGNTLSAEKWMGKEDGAWHATLWNVRVWLAGRTLRLWPWREDQDREQFSRELHHYRKKTPWNESEQQFRPPGHGYQF